MTQHVSLDPREGGVSHPYRILRLGSPRAPPAARESAKIPGKKVSITFLHDGVVEFVDSNKNSPNHAHRRPGGAVQFVVQAAFAAALGAAAELPQCLREGGWGDEVALHHRFPRSRGAHACLRRFGVSGKYLKMASVH